MSPGASPRTVGDALVINRIASARPSVESVASGASAPTKSRSVADVIAVLTIVVASVLVGATTAHAVVRSRWHVGHSMPEPSQHAGGATLGGKLYVIGG